MTPMKIVGLMPVRNEDWCLGLTARAALKVVDHLIIFDHASTDRTPEIAREIIAEASYHQVVYNREEDPTWREMAHRQWMLDAARRLGATHIVMIDADELLTGNIQPDLIRSLIGRLTYGEVLQLPWLALPRSIDKYIAGGVWGNGQFVSMAFKDSVDAHWTARAGYDFHHRNPMGLPAGAWVKPLAPSQGGLMHLQFLSERRLRAKQALYKMTETVKNPNNLLGRKATVAEMDATYSRAVYEIQPTKVVCLNCPAPWWAPYREILSGLHIDAEPWQEAECKRLMAEHGAEKFKELDLFGVV